jgi:hypothetical protein
MSCGWRKQCFTFARTVQGLESVWKEKWVRVKK